MLRGGGRRRDASPHAPFTRGVGALLCHLRVLRSLVVRCVGELVGRIVVMGLARCRWPLYAAGLGDGARKGVGGGIEGFCSF